MSKQEIKKRLIDLYRILYAHDHYNEKPKKDFTTPKEREIVRREVRNVWNKVKRFERALTASNN